MDCTLQIHRHGGYRDCAILGAIDDARPLSFQYDLDYAFEPEAAPVTLRERVHAEFKRIDSWPAFFYDLVPQGAGRTFLLGELGLPDTPLSDFRLVCAGAFNPIGRLRVAEAQAYFQNWLARHPSTGVQHGLALDHILERSEDFKEQMAIFGMLASGTTGVQGAAPKYLITQGHDGLWYGDGVLPDERAARHFIIKRPRGKEESDRKVLRNEAAYMRTAAAMGIRTYDQLEHRNDMLFIPRFDRAVVNGQVLRYHQESVASLAGAIGFGVRLSLFAVVQAIRAAVDQPARETLEFLKREALNLAMRNTDNHARNTAVQVVDGRTALTPLFDFAPMYLDSEGISRALRWYRPQDGVELTEWGDVIDQLALPEGESRELRHAMKTFGFALDELSDHMRRAGVDDDIIASLQMPIQTQAAQLKDLRD